MKNNLNFLLQDRITKLSIFSAITIFIVYIVMVTASYAMLPPVIPLFNSLPWGNARLTPAYFVFAFPVLFFIIFIFNNFIAGKMYKKHVLASRIFSFNSLLVIILGLIAYVQILLLVF